MTTVPFTRGRDDLVAARGRGALLTRLALVALALAPSDLLAQQPTTTMSERIEARLLERLAGVQGESDEELAPFTSDGCSGGLSRGWKYLSRRFPQFAERFGERPPWEACCLEHDHAYWRGRAENGYAARKAVDEALRQCVRERGEELSEEVAERWETTPEEVQAAFEIAGQIMYGAVRIGGRPCTPFAWRWGYGWPACDEASEAAAMSP